MKYFTDKKYGDNTAWSDYEAYCTSIWEDLPIDLQLIQEGMLSESMINSKNSVGLHDAKIIRYKYDKSTSKLEMTVNTDHFGSLRQAELKYEKAMVINDVSAERKGLDINNSDSDIMCHEIIETKNGFYTHSLLFASGEELMIEFNHFEMRFKDG